MNKDWIGNKKTTFVQLGASNHTEKEREINDFYSTDPASLQLFLDYKKIKEGTTLNKNIWECACGNGILSETLKKNGYQVLSTDLIDRGYGTSNIDFLKQKEKWKGDILTNPPYKYALEFVKKALELLEDGNECIMFLKVQFLEGQERRKFFDKFPPKYIYVNSVRQTCYLNGDMSKKLSSASCYCWFVWEKGWLGDPIVKWI